MLLNCGLGEDSRDPCTVRISNQSILKEINPEYLLEGLMLKLKLQYFEVWPPAAKNWLIWKDPNSGQDWRQEKGTTEDEMAGWHHQLNGHEFEQAPGVMLDREAWRAAVHEVSKCRTWLSDWFDKKNEILPFAVTWMDLEIVILKNVQSKKLVQVNAFSKWKVWDVENKLRLLVGKGGHGGDKLGD